MKMYCVGAGGFIGSHMVRRLKTKDCGSRSRPRFLSLVRLLQMTLIGDETDHLSIV